MYNKTEEVAFTQVLNILNNVDKIYYDKIPKNIIELLENNKIEYYQYYDEKGKTKISYLAEQLLCYINLEYWCDNDEKIELIKKYKKNDEKNRKKYNINKIFETRKKNNEILNNTKQNNSQLIEYKTNWFKRLMKRIFRR